MELPIGDKWLVTEDKYNWILHKKVLSEIRENKKPTGKYQEKMIEVGYYPVLSHALHRILQEDIKDLDEVNIQMVLDCIRSTEKRIMKAVKDIKRDGDE